MENQRASEGGEKKSDEEYAKAPPISPNGWEKHQQNYEMTKHKGRKSNSKQKLKRPNVNGKRKKEACLNRSKSEKKVCTFVSTESKSTKRNFSAHYTF